MRTKKLPNTVCAQHCAVLKARHSKVLPYATENPTLQKKWLYLVHMGNVSSCREHMIVACTIIGGATIVELSSTDVSGGWLLVSRIDRHDRLQHIYLKAWAQVAQRML